MNELRLEMTSWKRCLRGFYKLRWLNISSYDPRTTSPTLNLDPTRPRTIRQSAQEPLLSDRTSDLPFDPDVELSSSPPAQEQPPPPDSEDLSSDAISEADHDKFAQVRGALKYRRDHAWVRVARRSRRPGSALIALVRPCSPLVYSRAIFSV